MVIAGGAGVFVVAALVALAMFIRNRQRKPKTGGSGSNRRQTISESPDTWNPIYDPEAKNRTVVRVGHHHHPSTLALGHGGIAIQALPPVLQRFELNQASHNIDTRKFGASPSTDNLIHGYPPSSPSLQRAMFNEAPHNKITRKYGASPSTDNLIHGYPPSSPGLQRAVFNQAPQKTEKITRKAGASPSTDNLSPNLQRTVFNQPARKTDSIKRKYGGANPSTDHLGPDNMTSSTWSLPRS